MAKKSTSANRPGRPRKITQAVIDRVDAELRRGVYIETVADMVGISRDTFYRWLREGARELQRCEAGKPHPKGTHAATKKELALLAKFSDVVARAQADVEAEGVDAWRDSFRKTVRVYSQRGDLLEEREEVDANAVAKYLERRFPTRWKNRSEQALTGPDGGPVVVQDAPVDLSKLSDDDLARLHALAQKAKPSDGDA